MKIIDVSSVSLEAARAWAVARGAHERFVSCAWHYWNLAPRYGIPPEVAYAQAAKETAWGKYGGVVPPEYNNWCGLKTTRGGSNSDPQAHARFPDAGTGVLAHIQHLARYAGAEALPEGDELVDPRWGAVTQFTPDVEGLGGAWAPSASYGREVATRVTDLRDFARTLQPLAPPTGWTPPEIVRRILPRNASNTPRQTMDWAWITVHNTGNPSPGADALMHAAWLESLARSGASEPSWQYTVDDTRVVQHLEDDQAGWHASDGNGPGNLASLGFELVEIGNQERVLWNAGWVIAQKLKTRGLGVDRMRQHHDWARDKKNCPRLLRANNGAGWNRLIAIVESFLADGQPLPEVPSDGRYFPETGYNVGGGFLAYWEQFGGLAIFGYPITGEYQQNGVTVQLFERARFEWHPGSWPERFDVQLGLLGVELLAAQARIDEMEAA